MIIFVFYLFLVNTKIHYGVLLLYQNKHAIYLFLSFLLRGGAKIISLHKTLL